MKSALAALALALAIGPAHAETWVQFDAGKAASFAALVGRGFEIKAAIANGDGETVFLQKGAEAYRCSYRGGDHLPPMCALLVAPFPPK